MTSKITKMDINFSLKSFTIAAFAVLLSFASFANDVAHGVAEGESTEEEKFNVNEMIMHHVKDAHEWHLWGPSHGGTSIYLPVILFDDGMKIFSSSHFYHGELENVTVGKDNEQGVVMKGKGPAEGYALFHEKIYKLEGGHLHIEDGHPHNKKPISFSITKNVASLFLSFFVVFLMMFGAARFYKKNGAIAPSGLAKFVEPFVVFVRDDIAKENIGEKHYKKYLPYLLTIFFFIWISNMLGTLPILGSNLTGNISVTLFLALCTLLITLFSGNKNYYRHIFATPGVPKALLLIMVPIEIVGVFTKPFALMIRLFANITAGHIIILALVSIIFINQSEWWGFLSVPMTLFISILELLVALLQAYLFALLSALFIGAAVEEAHH